MSTIRAKSWGIRYSPDMHHGLDWDCACGFQLPHNLESRIPHLVGFDTDGPWKPAGWEWGYLAVQTALKNFGTTSRLIRLISFLFVFRIGRNRRLVKVPFYLSKTYILKIGNPPSNGVSIGRVS